MPSMQQKKSYDPPTSGRNDRYSPVMIDDTEASELENFIVNYRGVLDKVKGFQKDGSPFPNSSDSFIRMLINYKRGTTVDKLIMAAQDNGNTNSTYKVDYKYTSGDGTYSYLGHTAGTSASFTNGSTAVSGVGTSWSSHLKAGDKIKAAAHADSAYAEISSVNSDTSLTLTASYSGATTSAVAYTARIITDKAFIPRAIVFNNKCIITNGQDKIMTYDNTTLNLLTDADAPRAKFIEAHKSRVFCASTTGNPSRIFWSAVNDETSWDATSIEDVYPNDNGNIVAIKSFADSLIVVKNNGNLYQVVGDFDQDSVGEPDFIRKIDTPENIGIVAERSVVVHTDGLYFLSETGLWKLDPRLYVQKVSYSMDNFLASLNFALGPSQSKSYTFDTQSQWNSGTLDGLYSDSNGTLRNFADRYSITDCTAATQTAQSNGYFSPAVSATIDCNNIVHVVYVASGTTGTHRKVRYAKISVDGTITYEDIITEPADVMHTAVAVNAAGDEVSAMWSLGATQLKYMKRSLSGSGWTNGTGTASTADLILDNQSSAIDFQYQGSDIYGVLADGGAIRWIKRVGGLWTFPIVAIQSAGTVLVAYNHNSGNPRLLWGGQGTMYCYHTDDGGSNWVASDGYTPTSGSTCCGLEMSGGKAYSSVTDGNNLYKRCWDDGTNTLLNANPGSGQQACGYFIYNNLDYWFSIYGSTTTTEKFGFGSNSLTDSTSAIGNFVGNKVVDGRTAFFHNGGVFCSVFLGINTNEIVVRRFTPLGTWTSPVESDPTLTTWGTYTVGNPLAGGNTLAYTAAVSATSTLPTQSPITNGAVVSSDATSYFFQTTITATLTSLTSVLTIDSLSVTYTGAGLDCKQALGISYNTELYMACATTSDTANAHIIFLDIDGKFSLLTHPVSAFCRYKNKLYAGNSTNGDLIILRQTYLFDASAYTATFISKEDFLGSVDLEKDIFKIYVLCEVKSAGSFTFSYRLDNFKNALGSTWVDTTIDQTSNNITPGLAEVLVGTKAHTIQFKVTHSNADQECSVLGFVVVYGFLNQR